MNSSEQDKKLFAEFPPVTTAMWEEQIQADLKGADYEKRLIWKTQDGFSVKPYYRAEDLEQISFTHTLPGESPFVRGLQSASNHWEIRQDIGTEDLASANAIAVEAVELGAGGIGFNAVGVASAEDLKTLVKFIELEKTAVHFTRAREFPFITELFTELIRLRTADPAKVRGSLGFDPFNYYLLHGAYYNSLQDNLDEARYLITKIRTALPNYRIINVSGDVFHNAGATISQEVAYALASGNEYLSKLSTMGVSVDETAPAIQFTFALGSNYFLEIAKIRAARLLWATIVEAYHPSNPTSGAMFVHGTTSLWNKTIYDPYVNMLRSTTEAMAGAIAGCNSMTVIPFDAAYKSPDNFSMRIARNTQIILQEESYFNKIVDPAAGSYYIENLTNTIAEASWALFRQIEAEGGFLEAIKKGIIRESIEKSAAQRSLDIARRSTFVLGTNQFPNQSEFMGDKMTEKKVQHYPGLNLRRGAEDFEQLRLNTEQYVAAGNARPKVYLVNFGNLTMQKARAAFSSNFFGIGGYEVIDGALHSVVKAGVEAAVSSGARIAVLCSSDDEYGTMGLELAKGLKAASNVLIVVVAGNPQAFAEELRTAGVDEFIHVRTNALETLQQFNQALNIR
ncbi:MAG: methylmalonyl-CoA mutase family protein [Bacteroidales bacterium]